MTEKYRLILYKCRNKTFYFFGEPLHFFPCFGVFELHNAQAICWGFSVSDPLPNGGLQEANIKFAHHVHHFFVEFCIACVAVQHDIGLNIRPLDFFNLFVALEEVFKTRQRNGILVLVSLFERKVFVLADKGLE